MYGELRKFSAEDGKLLTIYGFIKNARVKGAQWSWFSRIHCPVLFLRQLSNYLGSCKVSGFSGSIMYFESSLQPRRFRVVSFSEQGIMAI